jgi:hypothetical protein
LERHFPWQQWRFVRNEFEDGLQWAEADEEWDEFVIKPGQAYCISSNRDTAIIIKVEEVTDEELG